MSDVTFILGGTAEIASSKDVAREVDRGTDRILGRLPKPYIANRRRIPASVSLGAAATGTWVLDFGSPQGGMMWWINEVIVTATDDRTAPAAAVAALYCGVPARQVGNAIQDPPILGSLVRPAVAIPATFTFAKEVWPVQDGENLFAILYSTTTAIQFMAATATVQEVPGDAVLLNVL